MSTTGTMAQSGSSNEGDDVVENVPMMTAPLKSEDDKEPQPWLYLARLLGLKSEDNADVEAPTNFPTQQIKLEADRKDYGGPELASNQDPNNYLHPIGDGTASSSSGIHLSHVRSEMKDGDKSWSDNEAHWSGVNSDVALKTEDDEKERQPWLYLPHLIQIKTEDNMEEEAPTNFPAEPIKLEPNQEFCGDPELTSDLETNSYLQPNEDTAASCSSGIRLSLVRSEMEDGDRTRNDNEAHGSGGNSDVEFNTAKISFSCPECGEEFHDKQSLEKHSTKRPLSCMNSVKRRVVVNNQQSIPTRKNTLQCDVCDRIFCHEMYLKAHMRTHTKDRPYSCEHCGKSFICTKNLNQHIKIHTGNKPHCEERGQRFSRKANLNQHMRNHTEDDPFSCDVINSSHFGPQMKNWNNNEAHGSTLNSDFAPLNSDDDEIKPLSWLYSPHVLQLKIENNMEVEAPTNFAAERIKSKPNQEVCGAPELTSEHETNSSLQPNGDGTASSSSGIRLSHVRSEMEDGDKSWNDNGAHGSGVNSDVERNTAKKSFSCPECDEEFHNQESLQRHLTKRPLSCLNREKSVTQNVNIQKIPCDVCGTTFSHEIYLSQHMRIHTEDRELSCDQCGRRFSCNSHLRRHMRIHTVHRQFSCVECGHEFNRKEHLTRHMRIHTGDRPFSCNECGQRFIHKTDLNQHMTIHTGERAFSCDVCGQTFSRKTNLSKHIRTHTGERPFSCNECGKRYRDNRVLNRHMRIHAQAKSLSCNEWGVGFLIKTHLKKNT